MFDRLVAAENELVAENAHGLANRLPDDRLAGAGNEPADSRKRPAATILTELDDASSGRMSRR